MQERWVALSSKEANTRPDFVSRIVTYRVQLVSSSLPL
jgi:hypothetical protein